MRVVDLRIPPEAIQIRDVLLRELVGIEQRREDIDGPRAPTGNDDVITDLAECERFRDLRVRGFVHSLRTRRSRPRDEVIVLA